MKAFHKLLETRPEMLGFPSIKKSDRHVFCDTIFTQFLSEIML